MTSTPTPTPRMKLLVTGGAGYVGSVCAARLLEAGHEVVVLDDLCTGHADALSLIHISEPTRPY